MDRRHRTAILLLALLWLALVGVDTALSASAPARPAVQDELERELARRGARVVRYGAELDPAARSMLLAQLQLEPRERAFLEGQTVAPAELPEGWFRKAAEGQLDPAAQKSAADRDVTMFLLGWLWLGASLIGGLAVYAWWLARGRKLQVVPEKAPAPEQAILLFVTWQLGAMLSGPVLVRMLGSSRESLVATQLICYGLGLAFVMPVVGSFRPSLRGLFQGLAAFWAAGLGVIVVDQIMKQIGHPMVSRNNALDLFRNTEPGQLVWLGILVVLAGPFFEEYLFRGLLFGGMRSKVGEWSATLISAGLFALAHRDPAGYLPYTLLGIVFARTYSLTGSLFPSMVAHSLFNCQTFALLCLLSAG